MTPPNTTTSRDLAGSSVPDNPLAEFLHDPNAAMSNLLGWLTGWLPGDQPELTAPILLAIAVVVGWAVRWLCWRTAQSRMAVDARVVTVAVPPSVDAAGAATLWANLTGLLQPAWRRWLFGQAHVCFEYAFTPAGLSIRVWVPGAVPAGLVEHAIEAAWPSARTYTAPAAKEHPSTANPDRQTMAVGGRLRLARAEALPLRTEFPTDPLRALLGAPGPLYGDDRAVVQVLARPVTGHRTARARRADTSAGSRAGTLTGGLARAPAVALRAVANGLFDVLTTPTTAHRNPPPRPATTHAPGRAARQYTLAEQARDRAVVANQTGALYETEIRYATTASLTNGSGSSEVVRDRLRGRAHAIAAAFELFTAHNHYRRHRMCHPERVIGRRWLGRGDLLSVPELAAIAHLPTDELVTGLDRAGAKAVAPPPGIPGEGPTVRPIGDADAGPTRPVGIDVADARQHIHLIGATGSGKSELLARMILADAHAGRGLMAVDPKGDLIPDILARLDEDAGQRVVLFDATSHTAPPCLNPLEGDDPARVVDNLASIFSRVYSSSWGPRTDDILRTALLTLHAQPAGATLLDLPALLSDHDTRAHLTAGLNDDLLTGFWDWYDQLTEAARGQVVAPLMNKLRGFLLRPFMRDAIAAGDSTVNLNQILDEGGICLVRAPSGVLGPETARLFGSLIVAQTWQAATARADQPPTERRDASLYVDEAHNFLNLPYTVEDMLAEARGYRLAMTLAHQNLAQLPRELADGLATNARTKIYFATGPDDAARLARHSHPHLSEHDLAHLGAFQAAVRPVIANREAPAFTVTTRKLPPAIPGRERVIRAAAGAANAYQNESPPASGGAGAGPVTGSGAVSVAGLVDPRRSPTSHHEGK